MPSPNSGHELLNQEWPVSEALTRRMHRMFYPETIAVVGASQNTQKWSYRVVRSILAAEFPGRCIPVNPKGGKIMGLSIATHLGEISGEVDLALVVVSPSAAISAVEECVKRDVGTIFVITAGFSEVDEAGLEVENKMADLVRDPSIPLAGPNGQGLTCTQGGVCAQMFPLMPPKGGISVVAQSGNIGVSMAHFSAYHNVGLSKVISAGNEAFLTTAHYLDYLAQDDDTTVVAVYLEGAEQGRHLMAALTRCAIRKPVVVLKSGRTDEGARAAVSHTGALAGSDRIYDAVFRQAGAVRVGNVEELFDAAATFATQPLPEGNRVGVVTVGGGWGVLAADAAASGGLDLAPLPADVKARLDDMLPRRWSRSNPVDFAAAGGPDTRVATLEMILSSGAYDSVVQLGAGLNTVGSHFIATSRLGSDPQVQAETKRVYDSDLDTVVREIELKKKYGKPLVVASDALLSAQVMKNPSLLAVRKAGQYVLSSPNRALRVLGHLTRYAEFRRRKEHREREDE